MACIASHPKDVPVRATDLAEATQIPLPYLQKVLRRMVVGELLTGRKGHGGGFLLARPSSAITFADVLRAAEFDVETDMHCSFGYGQCGSHAPCPLHPAYSALKDAFQAWADAQRLSDVDCSSLLNLRPGVGLTHPIVRSHTPGDTAPR